MNVSKNELRKQTVSLIREINEQIEVAQQKAASMKVAPYLLVDTSGNYIMSPLLLAKATAYNTLVKLNE